MEYLMINKDLRSNQWRLCEDKLPYHVHGHQMNLLQNKIILTGGKINRPTSDVWQGSISFNKKNLRVNWTPLPRMMETRRGHVAVVIQDKLFCIGGHHTKSTEYFSFETNRWHKGPELPSELRGRTKGVLTMQQNQCFLVGGGKRDNERAATLSLFDPIKGVKIIEESLDIPRFGHIAVTL
jgi:N-acetylneuraminic acid mutarotase